MIRILFSNGSLCAMNNKLSYLIFRKMHQDLASSLKLSIFEVPRSQQQDSKGERTNNHIVSILWLLFMHQQKV